MSEYQYYEFQAIDRPLTERGMQELRRYSTRATITPTRFVNHYEWGDFKGSPPAWMEKYFDAFLYLANWGTHELMLRLPRRALDLETAKQYLVGGAACARAKGEHIILEFHSESEDCEEWDDGSGWLSSLIPVRADIASGDLRALYLAWLLCVQGEEVREDSLEPAVPAGLGELTAPLKAFADFLRIDANLIAAAAAAERSNSAANENSRGALQRWVAALPEADKTDLLVRVLASEESYLRAELLRRYRDATRDRTAASKPRTVGEIRAAAKRRADERRQMEAQRAAREQARREREEASARENYLKNLAKREPALWEEIEALIATKKPAEYDKAVSLLQDLRDLGARSGRANEVLTRIRQLRDEHAKKVSFVRRLERAGLIATAAR